MRTEILQDHITKEISLMPEYHIEIFGEKHYKNMLMNSSWKNLGRKISLKKNYIRTFVYWNSKTEYVTAEVHFDKDTIYDVQYSHVDLLKRLEETI